MSNLPSYVHGTGKDGLLPLTVQGLLEQTANQHPKSDALVIPYQNVRWTYRQLQTEVERYAAGFAALGLQPGERIGVWAPNCWEWVVTQFASARAGLILVNINPAYRLSELAHALETTECSALIATPRLKTSNYVEMLHELIPELRTSVPGKLASKRFKQLRLILLLGPDDAPGFMRFEDVPGAAEPKQDRSLASIQDTFQFDDPINIQFTSGTTGTPKAATLTHHNIVNNAWFVGQQMKLSASDRMCIPVPMYHCFGMVLGTLCCVAHGCAMVFASAGFDAAEVLKTVAAERCTVLHGVPTMFIAELEVPDFSKYDLDSLRTGIMAGAPCPVELMHRVMGEMHLTEITIAYGMTETGPVSTQTSVDDPVERRVTTVGRVLPHIEIKIVNDEGHVVPRGMTGELLTRGYCVMPYYWNDPERTAKAIDDARWIASGDVALLDDEGYCQIVGRLKDMLIRGGENIFPREIEEFLYQHPAVEQAEVIGVPDEKYGEQVCAWIKLREGAKATAEDIRAFCEGKIAHFKIPHYIRFVDEFPMTVTGKVQKYVMREQMIGELSATAEQLNGQP
jgi:fatty-acyl-CoA synthase